MNARACLLFLLMSAACQDPTLDVPVSEKDYTASSSAWEYVGPGSMGAFTSIALDPDNTNALFVGSDVGGVYYADDITDTGQIDWENITGYMHTGGVLDLAFDTVNNDLYVGTISGLYYRKIGGAVTWTHKYHFPGLGPGFGEVYDDYTGNKFKVPIKAVAVYPVSGYDTHIWVGVGESPKTFQEIERYDVTKVYYSADGGATWKQALHGFGDTPVTTGSSPTYTVYPGEVFDILIHPEDPATVWVSTDRGLYYTEDAGEVWWEYGTADLRCSDDYGVNWYDSSSFPTDCATAPTPCTGSTDCLPIIQTDSTGGVEHADLRELAFSWEESGSDQYDSPELVIYAIAWDEGFAVDSTTATSPWYCVPPVYQDAGPPDDSYPCYDSTDPMKGCEETFKDTDFAYYQGGLFRSEDLGLTWTQTLNDTVKPQYRCSELAVGSKVSSWSTTLFASVSVPEEGYSDDAHYLVGAVGSKAGVWWYDGGIWDRTTDINGTCYDTAAGDCFDGTSAWNIAGNTNNLQMYDVTSHWESMDTPTLYGVFNRGGVQGEWSSTNSRFEYEHLGSVWDSTNSAWLSRGLDDACVAAFIGPIEVESQTVWAVGALDAGVLLMTEASGAQTWQNIGLDVWEGEGLVPGNGADDTLALALSSDGATLYASNDKENDDGENEISILRGTTGTDPFDDWEVIGGRDSSDDPVVAVGGLELIDGSTGDAKIYTLALEWDGSDATTGRLLAGSSQGLWLYDASSSSTLWTQLCTSDIIPTEAQVYQIITHDDFDQYAYVLVDSDTDTADGVYYVDLYASTITCTQITPDAGGSQVIVDPTSMAFVSGTAALNLLVSSVLSGTPGNTPYIYSTINFNPSSPTTSSISWIRKLDPYGFYGSPPPFIQGNALRKMSFDMIAVDPDDTHIAVAALHGDGYFDAYNPDFLYRTTDGGNSWSVLDTTDRELPRRNLLSLVFGLDGEHLYAGSCSSLYRGENPAYVP